MTEKKRDRNPVISQVLPAVRNDFLFHFLLLIVGETRIPEEENDLSRGNLSKNAINEPKTDRTSTLTCRSWALTDKDNRYLNVG